MEHITAGRNHQPDITPGGIAPHIAADYYHQLDTEGATRVVVVQAPPTPAPRNYVGPVCLVLATAMGGAGLVVAILALIQVAAQVTTTVAGVAGAGGIGLSIKLARKQG